MSVTQIHRRVTNLGYVPGPPLPDPERKVDVVRLDRQFCAEQRCEACGTVGLEYHRYHRLASYRFFGVCPNCGAAEEF